MEKYSGGKMSNVMKISHMRGLKGILCVVSVNTSTSSGGNQEVNFIVPS